MTSTAVTVTATSMAVRKGVRSPATGRAAAVMVAAARAEVADVVAVVIAAAVHKRGRLTAMIMIVTLAASVKAASGALATGTAAEGADAVAGMAGNRRELAGSIEHVGTRIKC